VAIKLSPDEDIDPFLAPVLRERGIDCLSTRGQFQSASLRIIISDHLPFRELLRRVLVLVQRQADTDLNDAVPWLQDFRKTDFWLS